MRPATSGHKESNISLGEQRFPKPWVGGSNPSRPTILFLLISDGYMDLCFHHKGHKEADCSKTVVLARTQSASLWLPGIGQQVCERRQNSISYLQIPFVKRRLEDGTHRAVNEPVKRNRLTCPRSLVQS